MRVENSPRGARTSQRGGAAAKKFGPFTTEDTEVTEAREKHWGIVSQISFLCLFLRVLCALCGASSETFAQTAQNSQP